MRTPDEGRREAAVEVADLVVSYGAQRVLDGINLTIPAGSIFALLGPNGAGKTTLVNTLSTLVRPDSGTAHIAGHDVVRAADDVRRIISMTGQFAAVDDVLTARENLMMMCRLVGLGRAAARARSTELSATFDLDAALDRRVRSLSGGTRRRLDIAIGLVSRPQVIFLDEPTTGLDPRSRQALWDVVRDLARDGATVLLTTQYLEEADQLADRIAVLDAGRIVAEGTGVELKARVAGRQLELRMDDEGSFARARALLAGRVVACDPQLRTLTLASDTTGPQVLDLLNDLDAHAVEVAQVSTSTASLDDVFFALTGHHTPSATAVDSAADSAALEGAA